MKDFFDREFSVGDVVIYGNNAGFITLALVVEVLPESLKVVKRGYRDTLVERELPIPSNVFIVTQDIDLSEISNPVTYEDLKFIKEFKARMG